MKSIDERWDDLQAEQIKLSEKEWKLFQLKQKAKKIAEDYDYVSFEVKKWMEVVSSLFEGSVHYSDFYDRQLEFSRLRDRQNELLKDQAEDYQKEHYETEEAIETIQAEKRRLLLEEDHQHEY